MRHANAAKAMTQSEWLMRQMCEIRKHIRLLRESSITIQADLIAMLEVLYETHLTDLTRLAGE